MKIECRTYHNGSFKEWKINDHIIKTVYHKGTWFNENCYHFYQKLLTSRR